MRKTRTTCYLVPTMTLILGIFSLIPLQAQEDGFQRANVREVEPTQLAVFKLENGNEVMLLGVPEDNELMMGELTDAGGAEEFVIDPSASPAEIFALLAPADLPVPRMIAEADQLGLLVGRDQVETLPEPIEVHMGGLGKQTNASLGGGSCTPGSVGANHFREHHCGTREGPGYGSREQYCYSGSYNWVQKTSRESRRVTYTRMASCGSGLNRLRHFYKNGSGFFTQVNIYVDSQKILRWWTYKTGDKRYRRVRFEEAQSSGWVRGWAVYWSNVAN